MEAWQLGMLEQGEIQHSFLSTWTGLFATQISSGLPTEIWKYFWHKYSQGGLLKDENIFNINIIRGTCWNMKTFLTQIFSEWPAEIFKYLKHKYSQGGVTYWNMKIFETQIFSGWLAASSQRWKPPPPRNQGEKQRRLIQRKIKDGIIKCLRYFLSFKI